MQTREKTTIVKTNGQVTALLNRINNYNRKIAETIEEIRNSEHEFGNEIASALDSAGIYSNLDANEYLVKSKITRERYGAKQAKLDATWRMIDSLENQLTNLGDTNSETLIRKQIEKEIAKLRKRVNSNETANE